jgi:hypothetical protein
MQAVCASFAQSQNLLFDNFSIRSKTARPNGCAPHRTAAHQRTSISAPRSMHMAQCTSTDRSSSYAMMWKYASHPLHEAGAGSLAMGSFKWFR